ncbi:MAG: hypothetical protein V8S95_13970 [Odoribacter sp.]
MSQNGFILPRMLWISPSRFGNYAPSNFTDFKGVVPAAQALAQSLYITFARQC